MFIRKISSSSSSASSGMSDDSSDASSDGWRDDPTCNAAIFEELWDKEDRPAKYRSAKEFNKLPQATAFALHKAFSEKVKQRKGTNFEAFNKSKKLKERKFKKGADDGYNKLHEARFLRIPYGPAKKWWQQVPVNRDAEGSCLDLPLEFVGMESLVAQKTQLLLHDRSYPMQLRMLSPENVNISTRAKKRIERMEGGKLTNITDYWWTDVDGIKTAQDCILSYTQLLQILWPMDPTGILMLRLLHQYGWIAVTGDEGKRVAVVQTFFETVMKENCQKAVNKKPPLKLDEQEAVLKRILSRYGLKNEVPFLHSALEVANNGANKPAAAEPAAAAAAAGPSGGGRYNQRQKPKFNKERKIASYNGLGTCYDYNGKFGNKCRNSKGSSSSSCKDPNSKKEFAHVCNRFVPAKNDFCLQRHPRADHR